MLGSALGFGEGVISIVNLRRLQHGFSMIGAEMAYGMGRVTIQVSGFSTLGLGGRWV